MEKDDMRLEALRDRAVAARKEMEEVQELLDAQASVIIKAATELFNNLSLRGLARRLKVSPTYLCSVAKGRSRMTVDLLDGMVSEFIDNKKEGTDAQATDK